MGNISFSTNWARHIYISGKTAYIASYDGLYIADVSHPSSPALLAKYGSDSIGDVLVQDKVAYLSTEKSGLQILDVSNPSSPTLLGKLDLELNIGSLFLQNSKLFATNNSRGLFIIDVSNPSSPSLEGSYLTAGTVIRISVKDNKGYISTGEGGMVIIDTSDISKPTFLGALETKGYCNDIFASNGKAYIADGKNGLLIADVSDPTSPSLIGSIKTENALYVSEWENTAFVANAGGILDIIDVTDPISPTLSAQVYSGSSPIGIYSYNGRVYVANSKEGIIIIDATTPSSPSIVGAYYAGKESGFSANKTTLYYSTIYGSFSIADAENPSLIDIIGKTGIGESGYDLSVSGNLAYFDADEMGGKIDYGVAVFDIENPSEPKLIAKIPTGGTLFADGKTLYVSQGWSGLEIWSTPKQSGIWKISKRKVFYKDRLSLEGTGFGKGKGKVFIISKGNKIKCRVKEWTENKITVAIPWGARIGKADILIISSDKTSKKKTKIYFKGKNPVINKLSSKNISVGNEIIIKGKNFGPEESETEKLIAKGFSAVLTSWKNNEVRFKVEQITSNNPELWIETRYGKSRQVKLNISMISSMYE
ncbi:MAG: hypothetical protein D6734_07255 [Candidatus Schekmanbacteria bacterium]|nr:MAG: hypothetical protein D6734_07255 [Candidatus Schekmanbacteria bacterium]